MIYVVLSFRKYCYKKANEFKLKNVVSTRRFFSILNFALSHRKRLEIMNCTKYGKKGYFALSQKVRHSLTSLLHAQSFLRLKFMEKKGFF